VSVFKPTGGKLYTYSFQLGGRRFHGPTGKANKQAAKEVERAAKVAAAKTVEQDRAVGAQLKGAAPLTFDVAAGKYWSEVGEFHAGAATTWTDLERLLGKIGGARLLDQIRDTDINDLVAWRRGHHVKDRPKAPLIQPATVNRSTVDLLRKIFTRAKRKWGATFPHEPDWKEHRLKERGEVVREMKVTEEDAFNVELAEGYRDLWRFAVASGLRLAECFLEWRQIDWDARTITVIQKGSRPHTIPLTAGMLAIITPQRGRHPVKVFTYVCQRRSKGRTKGDRYPVTYQGMKTAWRRKRVLAGASDLRFHDNRHTAASRLIRRTGNLKAAQKLLGHADVSTTARYYAHVDMDDLRNLLDGPGRNESCNDPAKAA
jgi:integrase